MYVQYGSFRFNLGEPSVSITRDVERDATDSIYATRERWDITGLITQDGPSSIKTRIAQIEAAFAEDGQDLKLVMPDGTTDSNHVLKSADCLGGTKVIRRPSFPKGDRTEHVTTRTFSIVVEGLVLASSDHVLLRFEEQIAFAGGGPEYGHLVTRTGLPVKQLLTRHTPYRATQIGRALGLWRYPDVPSPVWPAARIRAGDVIKQSPRRSAGSYYEYEISWRYEFESALPLVGSVHRITTP